MDIRERERRRQEREKRVKRMKLSIVTAIVAIILLVVVVGAAKIVGNKKNRENAVQSSSTSAASDMPIEILTPSDPNAVVSGSSDGESVSGTSGTEGDGDDVSNSDADGNGDDVEGDATSTVNGDSTSANGGTTDAEALQAPVSLTLTFTGDCTLGTDIYFDQSSSFNAFYTLYGGEYFLENVRDIFEADDLTIVNMEGTFTEASTRADKTFAFKGSPEYVSVLTSSSVEAANLANNHSKDYGDISYTDTQETLKNAGIEYFGNGEVAIMEVNGVRVGLSGVYELADHENCEAQLKSDIETLQEAGADIIAVEFHWGYEKDAIPNTTQTYLAHKAVDYGADLVVGSHAHVVQGIEIYQNVPIVYGLGNFCFGGNSNPSDKDTMIFQQTFTIGTNREITDSEMNVIPCSISSVSAGNDYKPTPLTGDEATRVLAKIQERSDGIADTYGYTAAQIVE